MDDPEPEKSAADLVAELAGQPPAKPVLPDVKIRCIDGKWERLYVFMGTWCQDSLPCGSYNHSYARREKHIWAGTIGTACKKFLALSYHLDTSKPFVVSAPSGEVWTKQARDSHFVSDRGEMIGEDTE